MASPTGVQSPQPESGRSDEPVVSPHPHRPASQPPSKEKKGTRWTDAVWTLPLKILAFREVVGQGWFSLTAQTDNRKRAVDNLNMHQHFKDTGKKLSMGQMLSMVGEEMSKRRSQRANDVRATGAGNQAYDGFIKLVEDALQLEDDFLAVKEEKEKKKNKKNEKEILMRDRAEKLRKAAMKEKMRDDAGNMPKGEEGEEEEQEVPVKKKKRFNPLNMAQEQAAATDQFRRDRAADMVAKRELQKQELEFKKLERIDNEKQKVADREQITSMVAQNTAFMTAMLPALTGLASAIADLKK